MTAPAGGWRRIDGNNAGFEAWIEEFLKPSRKSYDPGFSTDEPNNSVGDVPRK
jgi:hypothetical protein